MRQRLASMSGHVTDDDRELPILECEHVVEVTARARTGRRSVGHGGAHRSEPGGENGEQGRLKKPDVLEQLPTLMLESPRACGAATIITPPNRFT